MSKGDKIDKLDINTFEDDVTELDYLIGEYLVDNDDDKDVSFIKNQIITQCLKMSVKWEGNVKL
tara:strand:- start:23624 stop:23815 length:192 start_codon:yes stop_codon:yes gene_type:complete